jgi:hypothetical protein
MPSIASAGATGASDPRTLYGLDPGAVRRPTSEDGQDETPGSGRKADEAASGGRTDPTRPADGVVVHLSGTARDNGKAGGHGELTDDQKKQVAELEKADRKVRQHEAAHQAAAGTSAGAASYSYTVGPDGKRYATSGEVSVDVSPVPGDPKATVRKMEQIARAALAPVDPSGADRAVAAEAQAAAAQARQEIAQGKGESGSRQSGDGARAVAAYASSPSTPRGTRVSVTA